MAGYGIYGGVGIPSSGMQDPQGVDTGTAPIQSLDTNQIQSPVGTVYTGPSDPALNAGVGAGGVGGGSYGAPMGPAGSSVNSGFYGLGGTKKSQYYLPTSANRDLYSSELDPFQMSAKLGNGQIRDEDLGALRQATTNSQNPYYAGIAQYGIQADPYLNQFQNSGLGADQAAGFFQQQSQRGAMNGVNYGIDPTFGLTGRIGDLNFDVMQYDQQWNSPAAYNAWSPYIGGGWDQASNVYNNVGSIINQGGPRDYKFQQGVNSAYRPAVQNEAFMGNGLYFVG